MELSITFDDNEFEVYAKLNGDQTNEEQVNINVKALNAFEYKCAEFVYHPSIFDKAPTERQVIAYLRRILNDIGLRLDKSIIHNIKITKRDAEYLILELADVTNSEQALNIPAINNYLEALAVFIKEDASTISCNGSYDDVHCFRTKTNDLYSVAHHTVGLDTTDVVSFNSNLWAIKKVDKNSPYHRFRDSVVKRKLQSIKPESSELVSIDQKENTVVFKTGCSLFEWGYSSHWPDDLDSYYLIGSIREIVS